MGGAVGEGHEECGKFLPDYDAFPWLRLSLHGVSISSVKEGLWRAPQGAAASGKKLGGNVLEGLARHRRDHRRDMHGHGAGETTAGVSVGGSHRRPRPRVGLGRLVAAETRSLHSEGQVIVLDDSSDDRASASGRTAMQGEPEQTLRDPQSSNAQLGSSSGMSARGARASSGHFTRAERRLCQDLSSASGLHRMVGLEKIDSDEGGDGKGRGSHGGSSSSPDKKRKRGRKRDRLEQLLEDIRSNRTPKDCKQPDRLEMRRHKTVKTDPKIMRDLCSALKSNTTLTRLDLRGNLVTPDECVKVLVQDLLLPGNSKLTWIDLSCNGITNKGAIFLVDAIKKRTPLEHLDLRNNMFGEEMCKALVAASDSAPKLRKLELSACSLGRSSDTSRQRIVLGALTSSEDEVEDADARNTTKSHHVQASALLYRSGDESCISLGDDDSDPRVPPTRCNATESKRQRQSIPGTDSLSSLSLRGGEAGMASWEKVRSRGSGLPANLSEREKDCASPPKKKRFKKLSTSSESKKKNDKNFIDDGSDDGSTISGPENFVAEREINWEQVDAHCRKGRGSGPVFRGGLGSSGDHVAIVGMTWEYEDSRGKLGLRKKSSRSEKKKGRGGVSRERLLAAESCQDGSDEETSNEVNPGRYFESVAEDGERGSQGSSVADSLGAYMLECDAVGGASDAVAELQRNDVQRMAEKEFNGPMVPREMPVDALLKGYTLGTWTLPQQCTCDSECPVAEARREADISFIEGCFLRCASFLRQMRDESECECRPQCILAFFHKVQGIIERPENGVPVFTAVLRGMKELLTDNGYVGTGMGKQEWAITYINLLTSSLHWVHCIEKRVAAGAALGGMQEQKEKTHSILLKEFSTEGHFRRVLKALLYMLDQGPASAPTLTESIKIRAAAQSDDAGTAVWAPSGSSVQVEMVLQLWAELIGIYAKDKEQTKSYWDLFSSVIDNAVRPYNAASADYHFTLPSLGDEPAATAAGRRQQPQQTCDAIQSFEFHLCAVLVSVLLHRARGFLLQKNTYKQLETVFKRSPLSSDFAPSKGYASGQFFLEGWNAQSYELMLVEKFCGLIRCVKEIGHVRQIFATAVAPLWRRSALGRAGGGEGGKNLIACDVSDVDGVGVVGKEFDFAHERRRVSGQKLCAAVLHMIYVCMAGAEREVLDEMVSQLYSTGLNEVLLSFGAPKGEVAEREGKASKMANLVCMLTLVVRMYAALGDAQQLQQRTLVLLSKSRNCAWEKLKMIVQLETSRPGWLSQHQLSDIQAELRAREVYLEAVACFLRVSAHCGDAELYSRCVQQFMGLLELGVGEIDKALRGSSVDGKELHKVKGAVDVLEIHVAKVLRKAKTLLEEEENVHREGHALICHTLKKILASPVLVKRAACVGAVTDLISGACRSARREAVIWPEMVSNLIDRAWPALQAFLTGLHKDSHTEKKAEMKLILNVVSCCADLFGALSVANHHEGLKIIRTYFTSSKPTGFQNKAAPVRMVPLLFHSELACRGEESASTILNAWLVSMLDCNVQEVCSRTGDNVRAQFYATQKLCEAAQRGEDMLLRTVLKGVWDAMEGSESARPFAALCPQEDRNIASCAYHKRAAALLLFARNVERCGVALDDKSSNLTSVVFAGACDFVSKVVKEVSVQSRMHEFYLAYCYEVLCALMPACAVSMQACSEGLQSTVFLNFCRRFVCNPSDFILCTPRLMQLRCKLAKSVLSAVSTLCYLHGNGHARLAEVAKFCVRMKLLDDCSDEGNARERIRNKHLSIREMFSGCSECVSADKGMRGLVRLVLRWLVLDLDDRQNCEGHGGVRRAMRAADLLREIAQDVYMSSAKRPKESALRLLQDFEPLLGLASRSLGLENAGHDTNTANAVMRLLRGLFSLVRDSGVPYNEAAVCQEGDRKEERYQARISFMQLCLCDALFLALDSMFRLIPQVHAAGAHIPNGGPGAAQALWGSVEDVRIMLIEKRSDLRHAFEGDDAHACIGVPADIAALYREDKESLTPNEAWYDRAGNLVSPLIAWEAREGTVEDALQLASVLLEAGDQPRSLFLELLPDIHTAAHAALFAMRRLRSPSEVLCMSRWQSFLQRLGPVGLVYIAKIRTSGGGWQRAQSELQDQVFWMDGDGPLREFGGVGAIEEGSDDVL